MSKKVDRIARNLALFVTERRWLVIAASLLVVLAIGSGAQFLEFTNNYRVFFSKENPELLAFESFQDTYTKNDNFLFVLHNPEGDLFTPELAPAIEQLTEASWQIPYAIRVDSLSNFQHSWADGDDLTVGDLIRDAASMSAEELQEKKRLALAEPLLFEKLISPSGDTTGINVTLQYPEQSLEEVPEAVAVARSLADQIRADYPQLEVAISGVSMLNNAFAEAGTQDAMTLIPLMYAVLLITMVIALRSAGGTVVTLSVIVLSALAALGFAGWVGIKLTPISVTAPTIITTLAIADSIHVLMTVLTLMGTGMAKVPAIRESLRINFLPVSITSVTTFVGFLTLNFSDAPPFRHLGNITAAGIAMAWMLSLVFLPAVATLVPLKGIQRATKNGTTRIHRFGEFVVSNHRPILFGSVAVALGLVAMLPLVELNDEFVKYFDRRVEFRRDADFSTEKLSGVYLIEYSVPANGEGGISEPEYLKTLEEFATWLRDQPEVSHVFSYTDIIKRLNKNMHGDDPAWYKVPEDRGLAAQYLLLYELSLPQGLDLNDRISVDKGATRVTATFYDVSTARTREFLDRGRAWFADNAPAYMQTEPTGASVMFAFISQRNIQSMLRGNLIAIIAIALILMVALRSFGVGLLSLIPNGLPILATFGLWGLLVGQVGMSAATVTATTLGIVVDDTVHFLSKYLLARREKGLSRRDSVIYAFETVGRAIVATTVILVAGFAVLVASTFQINKQMGLLSAMTIIIALLFDFFLLPSLLLAGDRQEKELIDEDTATAVASS